ncbi:hypothetical protein L1049_020695 [Liquidambar formosana]|uniref:RING-type domain-containing protein n=1 Tax=Liquidambar formosana TaxID=63359 RepID=A0AAP0S8A7_LIQFO
MPEDDHHSDGEIPAEIVEHIEELFPEHMDLEDIVQYQKLVYQSIQTTSRSNVDRASDHDQSNDSRHLLGSGGQSSHSRSVDSHIAFDEDIARALQELDDNFENVSISETVGAAAGNRGVSSSETSVVIASQDDVDPDNMSYEQLQSLGEAIGIESRGLSEEQISRLPSQKYKGKSGLFSKKIKSAECVICTTEYTKGDLLTTLPCIHQYHSKCINRWFEENKTCPVCMSDVSRSNS